MCARKILSASLGSLILLNKSKLGSHFTSLSVLLCLMQIEIIRGAAPSPPPQPVPLASPPPSDGLGYVHFVAMTFGIKKSLVCKPSETICFLIRKLGRLCFPLWITEHTFSLGIGN